MCANQVRLLGELARVNEAKRILSKNCFFGRLIRIITPRTTANNSAREKCYAIETKNGNEIKRVNEENISRHDDDGGEQFYFCFVNSSCPQNVVEREKSVKMLTKMLLLWLLEHDDDEA